MHHHTQLLPSSRKKERKKERSSLPGAELPALTTLKDAQKTSPEF
jgi:hypothetical protein